MQTSNVQRQHHKLICILMVCMFALAWTAMKLSLPILPALETIFHTSTSLIKLSVSLFFAAYAISQLIWGSLSEKYGRRKIILTGFILSLCGTALVMVSTNIFIYITGRCIEGIGIGVVSPIGRAVLADVFERVEMARVLALVSSITGLMPALAPIVGGFILIGLGWRYVFGFFFILLVCFTIWCYRSLPETHLNHNTEIKIAEKFKEYFHIINKPLFWGYIACYMLIQGTLLGYYGAMPFWYVSQWHVPEQYYAFLGLFSVSGYFMALFITRRLVKKFSLEKILFSGMLLSILISFLSLAFALLHFNGVTPLVIIMSLFAVCSGIVFPSANAGMMSHFRSSAAMASAVSSTSMFACAAIMSWVESHLNVSTMLELSIVLLLVSIFGICVNYLFLSNKSIIIEN